MRILFSGVGAYGHIYPMIPLALAVRKAGHDVIFATTEPLLSLPTAFGLDSVAAGIGMPEAFAKANGGELDPADMTAQRVPELVATVFGDVLPRAFVKDLDPVLARLKPDLVVHESSNLGALLAAKRARIPAVRHGLGRVEDSAVHADNPARRRLAALAAEIDVDYPADRDDGDPYLDIYPESMQGRKFLSLPIRIPLRPVPVNEPGELPAWVSSRERSRPLAYLTLGTAFSSIPVLRAAVEGLAAIDVDVLVAAGPRVGEQALGELPEQVKVEAWVPQADLLPHLDLVVHHGGSGTALGALASGLPQLVLPQGADQFSNAEALLAAGAGARLAGGEVTAEAVATKARQLLADDSVRAAARAVAAEIAAMPSPEAVVPRLIRLASRG